jgi:hypothetical protein
MEPGTEGSTDGVLEDLVDAEEGEDAGLVVGHPQLLRHGPPYRTNVLSHHPPFFEHCCGSGSGMKNSDHISKCLETIFLAYNTYIL